MSSHESMLSGMLIFFAGTELWAMSLVYKYRGLAVVMTAMQFVAISMIFSN